MKKFEVPYNFDKKLLTKLLPYKSNIKFLFFAPFEDDWGHARFQTQVPPPKTREEYSSHIKEIIKNDYVPALLVQELGEIESSKFDFYFSLGIRTFIVTNDNNAKILKDKGAKYLIASITKSITPEEVNMIDDIYDSIVLPFEFARNIQLFDIVNENKKNKLVLLVNSYCAYDCKVRKKHWHDIKGFNLDCPYLEGESKKISYVPADDLHFFDNLVESYKLQGRDWPTELIYENVKSYVSRVRCPYIDWNTLDSAGIDDKITYYNLKR